MLDAFDEKRRGDAEFTGQAFTSVFGGYENRRDVERPNEELRWTCSARR